MADAVLSVAITAEIDALRDSFNKAIRETDGFDKNTKAKLASIDKGFANLANTVDVSMNKAASSTKKASNDISRDLAKTAAATAQSGQAIKKSGTNYLEFGRVLQDLPFGFTGIQNNLTQLIPSVGLAGLAFSALISAITFASVGTDNWTRGLGDNKEAVEKSSQANEDYAKNLTGVAYATLEGGKAAISELSNLRLLYDATQNNTLSIKERTKAAKILQDTYPDTFKNFSTEQILLGNVQKAYDGLTKSIISQAVVKAASDKVAENSIKRLDVEGRLRQKQLDLTKQQTKSEKALNDAVNQTANRGTNESTVFSGRALKEAEKTATIEGEIGDLRIERFKIDKENLQLNKFITDEIKAQGVAVLGLDDNLKAGVKSKKEKERGLLDYLVIKKLDSTQQKQAEDAIKGLAKESFKEPIIISIPIQVDLVNPDITNGFGIFLENLKEQALSLENNVVPLISDSLVSLGEAFNSGDYSQLGKGLLQATAGFLSQLGELLIKEGTANILAGIAQNIILPGSGVNRIVGGTGLIAAGAGISIGSGLLGSSSSSGGQSGYQVPRFATGVTGFGGGVAMVGERGPELVTLPTGSNVITNQNTNKLLSGGNRSSQKVQVSVVGKLSGQDIILLTERASKFNGRR